MAGSRSASPPGEAPWRSAWRPTPGLSRTTNAGKRSTRYPSMVSSLSRCMSAHQARTSICQRPSISTTRRAYSQTASSQRRPCPSPRLNLTIGLRQARTAATGRRDPAQRGPRRHRPHLRAWPASAPGGALAGSVAEHVRLRSAACVISRCLHPGGQGRPRAARSVPGPGGRVNERPAKPGPRRPPGRMHIRRARAARDRCTTAPGTRLTHPPGGRNDAGDTRAVIETGKAVEPVRRSARPKQPHGPAARSGTQRRCFVGQRSGLRNKHSGPPPGASGRWPAASAPADSAQDTCAPMSQREHTRLQLSRNLGELAQQEHHWELCSCPNDDVQPPRRATRPAAACG